MADENASGISIEPEQELAERLWHLRRGFEAAFTILFLVLIFGLVFHKSRYDVYLDSFLGSRVAAGGMSALREATPAGGLVTGWLWWVLSSGVSNAGGTWAVGLLSALLATVGFGVLLGFLRRHLNVVVAGLVLAMAAYWGRQYVVPNGQGAGIFFFGLLAALLGEAPGSTSRRFWFAVPVMAFWVNADLSWPIGAALCAVSVPAMFLLARPRRAEKAIAAAAALVATLANPDGLAAYGILSRLPLDRQSAAAFVAPLGMAVPREMPYLYVATGMAILLAIPRRGAEVGQFAAVAVIAAVAGVTLGAFPVAAISVCVALALALPGAVEWGCGYAKGPAGALVRRYVIGVFNPSGGEMESAGGTPEWAKLRGRFALGTVTGGIGLLVLLTLLISTVMGANGYLFGGGMDESRLPTRALEFVKGAKITGTVLASPVWCGYILTQAYPGVKPIGDTRPLTIKEDTADAVAWAFGMPAKAAGTEIARTLADAGVTFALVPQRWPRSVSFAGKWSCVYWDDISAVFVPNVPSNAALIAAHNENLTYPAFFLFGVKKEMLPKVLPKVIAQLEKKVAEQGDSAFAHYEIGMCYYMLGQPETAALHFLVAIGIEPAIAVAYHALGDVSRQSTDPAVGRNILKAFSLDPDLAPVAAALASVDDASINAAVAMMLYDRAIKHDPDFAMAYVRMGALLLQGGNVPRGIDCLIEAQRADDRRPQLDRVAPGLRKELDDEVKKLTMPRPRTGEAPPSAPAAALASTSDVLPEGALESTSSVLPEGAVGGIE